MASSFLISDPGALKFLLLIPIVVLLYMVRSRYRHRRVSSTILWKSVRRDLEAKQRFRLPPLSLLMLLQLLAIALGALALAKPALPTQDRTHLVVLVDVSASMEATDVPPSRFEEAAQAARRAFQQMQPGDYLSLVAMGPSPTLLASGTETTTVLAALDHLRPGTAPADPAPALKLAEALIQQTGGRGQVLLLSDGVFGLPVALPSLTVPVDYVPIGANGDNQGITALNVRPDLDGSGRWSAFARVSNYANHPVDVAAMATADGLLLDTRKVKLAPRGISDLSFALPPGTKFFALALDSHDSFSVDDRAEVQVETPRARSVLLVSGNAGPIEKVLQTLPGLKVTTVRPDSYKGTEGADLVILDDFVPASLPDTDLLIMNPPAGAPGFTARAIGSEATVLRSRRDSPLVESVDLQSLRLGQMVHLETPQWAHAILEAPGGPLILQGDRSGRRVVIFDFDWTLYDLPRMQAFPLLLSNALAVLNPMALPDRVHPGDSVLVRPVGDATEASVELPDGTRHRLALAQGALSFGDTEQVGRYTVTWKGSKSGEVSSNFNVNVGNDVQSDIGPKLYSFGRGRTPAGFASPAPGRQLWPLFALLLLGLLAVEWAYFARRS